MDIGEQSMVTGLTTVPSDKLKRTTAAHRLPNMASPDDEDLEDSDDEVTLRQNIELSIKHLSLESGHPHFLGKSSGLMFLQTALDMKEEYVGAAEKVPLANARPEFWTELPVSPFYLRALPVHSSLFGSSSVSSDN